MNILIIDDQKQVLDGIRSSINWHEIPEIEDVYYALNAYEAKNYFLNGDVDILVSDIEMPGESGLQLLSWVGSNFPETKCIMLTAHASFDYAQDALRLKAIDYILQPVKYETLREAVIKAVRLIEQENLERSPVRKTQLWDSFHGDVEQMILREYMGDSDLQKLLEKSDQLELPLRNRDCYHLLLISETLQNGSLDNWAEQKDQSLLLSLARHFFGELTDYLCIFEQYSHHFWMIARRSDPDISFLNSCQTFIDYCRENYMLNVAVYSGPGRELQELPGIYEKLYEKYRNNVAFVQKLFILEEGEPTETPPMPASSSWAKHFSEGTTDVIDNAVEQYLRRTMDNNALTSKVLLLLQQTFMDSFYESLHMRSLRIRNVLEQESLFQAYTRSTRSVEDFRTFTEQIFDYNQSLRASDEGESSSVIESAQEYISAHLSEEFSRDDVARAVHVSESYLSHLFPKELGMSLTDYITKERMVLARSLLTTTSLPVQMVAIRSGYNNISYFIRTFKKTFGITPNDYRKNPPKA